MLALAYRGPRWRPAWRPASGAALLVLGDSLSAEYGIARGTGWVSLLQDRLRGAVRL
jgi:acyl-CoA thioesterase-1